MKVKRELMAHLFDYGYLTEKVVSILIILVSALVLIVVPAWPNTVLNYMESPDILGIYSLGHSILTTTLLVISSLAAYLVPHLSQSSRARGSKEARGSRTRSLYLSAASALLTVTTLIYLLFALTTL